MPRQQVSELRSGDVCGELVAAGLTPVATATVTASETCFMQVCGIVLPCILLVFVDFWLFFTDLC